MDKSPFSQVLFQKSASVDGSKDPVLMSSKTMASGDGHHRKNSKKKRHRHNRRRNKNTSHHIPPNHGHQHNNMTTTAFVPAPSHPNHSKRGGLLPTPPQPNSHSHPVVVGTQYGGSYSHLQRSPLMTNHSPMELSVSDPNTMDNQQLPPQSVVYAPKLSLRSLLGDDDDDRSSWCRHLSSIGSPSAPVTCMRHSDDGNILATGGDRVTRFSQISPSRSLCQLSVPLSKQVKQESFVRSICFVNNDKCALSADEDGSIRLWKINSKRLLHEFLGHTDVVASVDARQELAPVFVSGSSDGYVRMWDYETGKCVHSFGEKTPTNIACVAVQPKSGVIAAAGVQGVVKLYDHRSAELIGMFEGHDDGIFSTAFSLQGLLATASLDGSVRLWDCRSAWDTKQRSPCVFTSHSHGDMVFTCTFSEDGRWLASGGADGSVCFVDTLPMHAKWQMMGFGSSVVAISWSSTCMGLTNGQETAMLCDVSLF